MATFSLKDILSQKSKDILNEIKPDDKNSHAGQNSHNSEAKKTKGNNASKPAKKKRRNKVSDFERLTLFSKDTPAYLRQFYTDTIGKQKRNDNKYKKNSKSQKRKEKISLAIKDLENGPKSTSKKDERARASENRRRVASSYHDNSIQTTSSVKAVSIPMGGQNKKH